MKVSIITASLESSKTISDCIVSINAQYYPEIEHIVIDGKSKDDTVKIINNQPNRVCLMVSEPDKMVYDALNKGFKYATGNVIGVLHSDDMFGSERTISNIVEMFEKTGADVVYGDLVFVHRLHTTKVLRYWKSSPFSRRKLNFGWMPPHPTVFIRREVYEKYGCFDLSFCISSDYDFLLRIFKDRSLKFEYMPELITIMRIGGISTGTFKNTFRKSIQDYLVLKNNNVQFPMIAVLLKIISKIPQLMKRSMTLGESKKKAAIIVPLGGRKWYMAAASVAFLMILCGLPFTTPSNYSNDDLFRKYYSTENILNVARSRNANIVEAVIKFQQKDYKTATQLFSIILQSETGNAATWFYNGIACIETEQFDNAIKSFQRIIADDNSLYIELAEWYLGLCYLKNNETNKAIAQFQKIESDSKNYYKVDAQQLLAKLQKKQ